ncbi:MAG: HIT domain-containing protein [Phycisphaerae bacterium]
MAESNPNVWAPWRMEYIRSLGAQEADVGCFLCHYWQHPQDDAQNFVLWRRERVMVIMNRFPYTNGHLLIAPARHTGDITALESEALLEMQLAIIDAIKTLTKAIDPQGFNIGYNVGRCAGAGLPDHVHAHLVPRWNADTNFMAVLGAVRVIPDGLQTTYDRLIQAASDLGVVAR